MHAGTCPNSHRRANLDTSPNMDTITRADLDTGRSGAGDDTNGDNDRRSDAAYGFTNSHSYPYIHADTNGDTDRWSDAYR